MTPKIWDTIEFLKVLTIRKMVNFLKLYMTYQYARFTKRLVFSGQPMSISIEPTTACNLRCPECPSGLRSFTRDTGNLKTDFYSSTIDQVSPDLMFLILYFQGEPYINPDFLKMVSYARERNIYTITSTNGHFLNDDNAKATVLSGLNRLLISIDGATQTSYEAYRKEGKLDTVLQGARNIVKWKRELKSKTPYIVFQFLVVRPNESDIPEIYRLAEEIGIDEVKLKTAQIYDYQHGNDLIPTQVKYSRYKQLRDGTYALKHELLNQCWKMWHSCVITWDGLVVPCCFDKDANHRLGDLKKESFSNLWSNDRYQAFRKEILYGRDKIDICTNCTEGCKVWESAEV